MAAHLPVLLAEAIRMLAIRPDGVYIDATFGGGGHSRAILARLGPRGRLIALDCDPEAVAEGQRIADARIAVVHARFSELARVLDAQEVDLVHGVLFDLGVSSPQLDQPARGFSFRSDGPLDMRMDPAHGESAAEWLARADESEIRGVIREYGEERFAKQIAAAIVAARTTEPLRSTRQLADLVGESVHVREIGQDPATRTFQAIRIFVNRELEEVSLSLPQAVARLAPGGRLAVISFHSLEDRIVKRVIAACARPRVPRGLPLTDAQMPKAMLHPLGRSRRAGEDEVRANPRARSAKLRVAERTDAPFDASLLSELGLRPWRS